MVALNLFNHVVKSPIVNTDPYFILLVINPNFITFHKH